MAYAMGALLGTMLDPLVIAAGIASFFIYRKWGLLTATWASAGFAFLLFAVVAVMSERQQMTVLTEKLWWLFLAIVMWAAISNGFGYLRDLGKSR